VSSFIYFLDFSYFSLSLYIRFSVYSMYEYVMGFGLLGFVLFLQKRLWLCLWIYVYHCGCKFMYAYVNHSPTHTNTHVHACTISHTTHTHARTHAHTHTRTHTHTYTHTRESPYTRYRKGADYDSVRSNSRNSGGKISSGGANMMYVYVCVSDICICVRHTTIQLTWIRQTRQTRTEMV